MFDESGPFELFNALLRQFVFEFAPPTLDATLGLGVNADDVLLDAKFESSVELSLS
jgi:hypothetical protein